MKTILPILCTIFFIANVQAQTDSWQQMQSLGMSGNARDGAVGFSIGSKGYIGTGNDNSDFWEYDPVTNVWTQKADFGGGPRSNAAGFAIDTKGYIGTGYYNNGVHIYTKDFWEYDPVTNIWTQKKDFGGTERRGATSFCIGKKGYIGTGGGGAGLKKDFWEYDPVTNNWIQKADFGGDARDDAAGFTIGFKGYIGTGYTTNGYKKDFWEYDPGNNRWTQKLDFSGTARALATGLSIGEKGYIGTGNDGNYKEDIFEFDPEINTWTLKTDLAGGPRKNAVGLSIGGYGYIGFGSAIDENKNDWWRYTPSTVLPLQLTSFTAAHTGKTNLLQWSSTQEINTSHFVIERSSNSNLFSKIGTVKTNGSGLQNNYSFTDQQPLKATNYYRLKITDKDSSFTCSKIKSLSNNLSFDVSITPNPVANGFINLTINTESLAAITITITTINGKILYTRQFAAVNGNLTKNIDVAAFAKGVYVLKATSGKESKMIKFVME